MVIAINTRILSGDNAAAKLLIDHFTAIAAHNTNHQFYFISNEETLPEHSVSNVKSIVTGQRSPSRILWKLWYNYTLPSTLKKIKADVLISADSVCSLRTKLPQFVIINDLAFLQYTEWYSREYIGFLKTNLPLFLKKAKGVITFSGTTKDELVKRFSIPENNIAVASFTTNKNYQPVSWEQREKVKEIYTEGNEYFLYTGEIHNSANLTNLLKAFSLFKKRQKSSMQLILLTDSIPLKNEFIESLRLYKYKHEVKLIEGLSEGEIVNITASAWCAVNLSPLQTGIYSLQNALLCETPVIAGDTAMAKELLGNASLYANPSSIDSVAEKLMLVYKDENKRKELVENGKLVVKKDDSTGIWENILGLGSTTAFETSGN